MIFEQERTIFMRVCKFQNSEFRPQVGKRFFEHSCLQNLGNPNSVHYSSVLFCSTAEKKCLKLWKFSTNKIAVLKALREHFLCSGGSIMHGKITKFCMDNLQSFPKHTSKFHVATTRHLWEMSENVCSVKIETGQKQEKVGKFLN